MRKLATIGVMAVLLLAMAGGVGAYVGRQQSDASPEEPGRVAKIDTLSPLRAASLARGCVTVRCFNQAINRIVNAHNSLVASHNQVANVVNNCLRTVPMAQYGDPAGAFGYDFSNDGGNTFFLTTGVDVVDVGEVADWNIVYRIC